MDEIAFFKLASAFLGCWLAGVLVSSRSRKSVKNDRFSGGSEAVEELPPQPREVGFQVLNKIGCFL